MVTDGNIEGNLGPKSMVAVTSTRVQGGGGVSVVRILGLQFRYGYLYDSFNIIIEGW